jgi:hypothetical protein
MLDAGKRLRKFSEAVVWRPSAKSPIGLDALSNEAHAILQQA